MGNYFFGYKDQQKQLIITLDGEWNYDEARTYQMALVEYVKNRDVKTVLIDQAKAKFVPECIQVFVENKDIPELKSSVTASVLSLEDHQAMMLAMKNSPPEAMQGTPALFSSLNEAERYLQNFN
jgi:hypothetical protein